MKQKNEKYCTECGELINLKAEICPKCGVRQPILSHPSTSSTTGTRPDFATCLLLCFFLGGLGVHRFYAGHTLIGLLQLLTLGGCGIWTLIDFIIIISGTFTDGQGNPIKNV